MLAHLPRHLDCPFVLRNPDTGTRYAQMNKGLKAAKRRSRWRVRSVAGLRAVMSAHWCVCLLPGEGRTEKRMGDSARGGTRPSVVRYNNMLEAKTGERDVKVSCS